MKSRQFLTLFLMTIILMLATYLRIFQLGAIPNGLHPDEAMRGYDAYALLKTGADSFGARFPLFLRGLEDYTPALYSYLSIPFIAIIDLSALSTRLASAFLGIITVALTYQLARRPWGQVAALTAAFLLAISPWHIIASRTGTEWNLLAFGPVVTIALAYRGLQKPPYLIAAGIAGGISLYGYAPIKAFLPLLIFGFAAFYRQKLRKNKRMALISLLMFILPALPIYTFSFSAEGSQRFTSVMEASGASPAKIAPQLIGNYFSYFSPAFLVQSSYSESTKPPLAIAHLQSVGLLSWTELLLIGLGIISIFYIRRKSGWYLLYWLIIAPVGINLHSNSPWPTLWLTVIPVPQALAGAGFSQLAALVSQNSSNIIRPNKYLRIAAAILVFILSFNVLRNFTAMHQDLFYQYPVYGAKAWAYGRAQAIATMEALKEQYDEVDLIATDLSSSIYLLFYTRYDPAKRHAELNEHPNKTWQNIDSYNIGMVEDYLHKPGCHLILTTVANGQQLKAQAPQIIPVSRFDFPDGEENLGLFALPTSLSKAVESGAVFNDEIILQGYAHTSTANLGKGFKAGQSICYLLQWQALNDIGVDYTVFVHLVGPHNPGTNSPLWAQHDSPPLHGTQNSSTWKAGNVVQDLHRFVIPQNAPAGQYSVEAGLYNSLTGERLTVNVGNGRTDDKVALMTFEIVPD